MHPHLLINGLTNICQSRPYKQVIQHSTGLSEGQLVSVTQYHPELVGAPLAVGRMAVPEEVLGRADEQDTKGKAVYVWHTWKDFLWNLGPSKNMDIPEPRDPTTAPKAETPETSDAVGEGAGIEEGSIPEATVSQQPEEDGSEGANTAHVEEQANAVDGAELTSEGSIEDAMIYGLY